MRAWVADAFATCVTGPAYVWAAMLLRADPTSAVDQRRVAVMVDVLELLASGLYDPDGNFVEVADRTRRTGGWPWPRRTRAKDRSSRMGRRCPAVGRERGLRSGPFAADRGPLARCALLADRFLELREASRSPASSTRASWPRSCWRVDGRGGWPVRARPMTCCESSRTWSASRRSR